MKKKILALCLVVALLATAIAGATLAYFTSETEVATNTFTVGNIEIKLDEAEVDDKGIAIPDGDRVLENDYHLYPGMTYDKDPTVTVLKGSEKCYVRAFVTINNQEALDNVSYGAVALDTILTGFDGTKWEYQDSTVEGDVRTYEFWYYDIVDAGAAEQKLEPLFKNIVIPEGINNADMQALNNLEITVYAHAMQAEGMADAVDAWSKW